MKNDILSELNFTDKESKVYKALLELDSAIAADIAKKADLNRTTAYDILGILIKRGLVSKYKKGSSTFFHAQEPKRLLEYLDREKEEQVKRIEAQKQRVTDFLPELISLQNPLSTKPKVQFFEGEKGIREAYEDTLTAKQGILAYTNVATMLEAMPHFFPEYFTRRTKAKVPIKAILVQNQASFDRAKVDKEELRETRFFVDPEKTFSPEIKIYNNKMVIASWNEKMAVMIESKELVDLQRVVFYSLWDFLPKHKTDNT